MKNNVISNIESSDELISINIGGTIFETYLRNLTQKFNGKSHLFSLMLDSKSIPVSLDSKKRIFVDRSSNSFNILLQYYQNKGNISLCSFPVSDLTMLRVLKSESDFYGLLDLKIHFEDLLYGMHVKRSLFPEIIEDHRRCKAIQSDSENISTIHFDCVFKARSLEIDPIWIPDVDEHNCTKYYLFDFFLKSTGSYSSETFSVGFYHDAFQKYMVSFTTSGPVALWLDVLDGYARWYSGSIEIHKTDLKFNRNLYIYARWGASKEVKFHHNAIHPVTLKNLPIQSDE